MKNKIINILLLAVATIALGSCSKEDKELLSNSNLLGSNASLDTVYNEDYDYIPLIDQANLYYGDGSSSTAIFYNTSEQVTPLNEFFKDLKFIKNNEDKNSIPFPTSLNVVSGVPHVRYEVTESGKVYFKNYDEDETSFLVATTEVDYVEFFDLFYADTYTGIRIGKNAK